MKISCRKKIALNSKKDAILIPVYRNMRPLKPLTGKKIEDEINTVVASDYFSYEEKEFTVFFMEIGGKLRKVYLVTVPKDPADYRYYTELGASFAALLRKERISSFSILSFEDIYLEKKDTNFTKSFLDGFAFGLYSFDRFKSIQEKNYQFEEAEVITAFTRLKRFVDENAEDWNSVFESIYLTKDLINTPPADMTPQIFVDKAMELASDKLKITVIDDMAVLEKDFPLVYAVGKGSTNPPKFLKLEYKGAPDTEQHVALVGKGVTFDSGGTNLKPSGSIEDMKCDMSGGATVLGVTKIAHDTSMAINIITYIPLVENIIGSCAYKPGDILTSKQGKTIEILNTDAEGRLILADALYEATKTDPEVIVDVATLTGACVVALGSFCAGLFSNRKFLAKNISDVSGALGEDIWELPLLEAYQERVKSDVADLRNISKQKGEAGSTVAGLFLQEFVDNWPWIHLDIAGPAFLHEAHPVFGKHASGFGVRFIADFLKANYATK
ncbi:MAG: leucyl aminopeptidase [Denitrovibrio sp.]|nr:MAG: leucyl aminopeptidase [Denitrovibrio sp.]